METLKKSHRMRKTMLFPMPWKQLKQDSKALIIQDMKWLYPEVWEDDNAYGRDSLEFLATHFVVPLLLTRFNHKVAIIEWK